MPITDRKVDAIIAERVFGWQRLAHDGLAATVLVAPAFIRIHPIPNRQQAALQHWTFGLIDATTAYLATNNPELRLPYYSTSLGDAWLVVEALTVYPSTTGRAFDLIRDWPITGAPQRYHARFGSLGPYSEAGTAPLAICIAALGPDHWAVIDNSKQPK